MKKGYLTANLRVNDPEIFAEFSSVAQQGLGGVE